MLSATLTSVDLEAMAFSMMACSRIRWRLARCKSLSILRMRA